MNITPSARLAVRLVYLQSALLAYARERRLMVEYVRTGPAAMLADAGLHTGRTYEPGAYQRAADDLAARLRELAATRNQLEAAA